MKQLSNILSGTVILIFAVLVVLNWSSLMIAAPINLGIAQVQAPLGVVMLGLAGIMILLFLVTYLHNQIGSLLETRKLHKDILRLQEDVKHAQELADKAEASRIENLHHLIATEFRLLNERLAALPDRSDKDNKLLSMTEIVTGQER